MKKLFTLFAVLLASFTASAENYILYTSEYNIVINPKNPDAFGAEIVSFTYEDGQGMILFDGDVTSIGDDAFKSCWHLTSITIPSTVKEIGDAAFYDCSGLEAFYGKYASDDNRCLIFDGVLKAFAPAGLTTYSIPKTVTEIGYCAFLNNRQIQSIEFPNSVTSIGDKAFYYCFGLTSIEIPNSVTKIGDEAFFYCDNLESVELSNSLTSIGDKSFWRCESLASIVIPGSVTSIGEEAFYDCKSLASIEIQNGVTVIGQQAFLGCEGLTSIEIPNSVTEIGYNAFAFIDGLKTAKLPDAEYSIGDKVFYGCKNLESFYGYYASEDHRSLIVDGKLLKLAGAGLTSYKIPNSVTEIEESACADCSSLTSIKIPESVKKINKEAFESCDGLTSIVLPSSLTEISVQAFNRCENLNEMTSLAVTPPSIINDFFWGGFNVETLYVPEESVEAYKSAEIWKWIDNIIGLTDEEIEALEVKEIQISDGGVQAAFDLSGRKVGEGYKGIVVQGGRKFVRK